MLFAAVQGEIERCVYTTLDRRGGNGAYQTMRDSRLDIVFLY